MINYETKVFTEPDGKKSRGKKGSAKIYIRALDNIHAAMKGCRLIERFGFKVTTQTKKEKAACVIIDDYLKWQYDLKSRDWLNEDYESTQTAFIQDAGLKSLLQHNIDIALD